MFEIRIHGRGGQGVVTAAELLSVSAFDEGRHAQAFPSFGSERTGAPVAAFCRIDDRPIRSREPVSQPDAVIVVDPTLLHQVAVFSGACGNAFVLINTARSIAELGLTDLPSRLRADRCRTVPATDLARRHLGRPLPNAALLGGFAALTGVVSLASVTAAIRDRFSGSVGAGNAAAAQAAYECLTDEPTPGPMRPQLAAGPVGGTR
ncbi:MAG TPA: 2-oxoacid:acceptor oxidoreductase family protein [Solirubrobacteraceae bacterium]|nr:2-oxoacid:acceptor oxidoreductase family protein [Solirubrobacteraceae bacterium]